MDSSSNDDIRGVNGDNTTVNGKSQSSCEHSTGREHQLLNSICNSNSASPEGDHYLSNSVISAGAFSRIGNSLSSGSHSESYTDTPTAAVDDDDDDDRLILNETFQRLGSKLMQDCIHTPIEDTTCSNGDRRDGTKNCNVENGQTPRTHNKSKPSTVESALDGETIPSHLNLPNDDGAESTVDDFTSPEQRRLENQVKQIEADIAEAEHSLQEEEQAQNQLYDSSARNRTSVDEDILMANGAVKSLQKQMEEADTNVYVLNSVSDIGDIDENDSVDNKEAAQPIKRSVDNGHVRATSTPLKKSQRNEQQLPPKSPMDNSSFLSRGISMFRASKQVSPTPRRSRGMDNDNSSVVSEITRGDISPRANKFDDGTLKRHLEESGLLLLKRLIEFLSECPPAPDEDTPILPSRGRSPAGKQRRKQRGLTLPATAIGWISHQIVRFDSIDNSESVSEEFEDTEEGYFVPKHQLQCVQFLLRRVVSVRISGEPWPPQAAAKAASANRVNQAGLSSRILSKFASDQSTAGESMEEDSCATSIFDEKEKNLTPFQRYYRQLQSKPFINMEIVPNATKVVIDGIPPNWVINLDSLKNLEMFQMEKGCLLDINGLFFPSDVPTQFSERHLNLIEEDDTKERHDFNKDTCETNEHRPFVYSSLSKLRLSNCAIGEMSGLRGRSKRSIRQYTPHRRPKRIPPFSRFPNLVSLNLSHNEIFRTKSAFAGLSSLPMLSSINLSYNRLSRLDDVFLYIGNITELILTGNEITTTRGLDRLFSLERLSLSENKIHNLSDIVGIANLPFLMNLDLKDNPLMEDEVARIKVLNLFREVRCKNLPKNATYRDMQSLLPMLDNELATKDELVALKDFTFRLTVIPTESRKAAPVPSQNDSEAEGESIVIDTTAEISVSTPSKTGGLRRVQKNSASHRTKVRVAGSLFLDDNATTRLGRFHTHLQQRKSNKRSEGGVSVKYSVDDLLTSIRPNFDQGMSAVENDGDYLRRSRLLSKSYMSQCSRNEDANKTFEDDKAFSYSLPVSLLEEASDDTWIPSLQADRITPSVTPGLWNETECAANERAKHEEVEINDVVPARVSLNGNTDFRSMYELDNQNEEESGDGLDLVEGPTTGMFDSVWEEAYQHKNKDIVLDTDRSDTGTNTQPLDFHAAEEDAQYDGPSDYSLLSVSRDLDLYFDSYVFPNDSDSDENGTRHNVIAPRIQMYKFDRDALTNSRKRDQELNPMGGDICERYLGVWREGVLACGPYARKRLAPFRLRKRGFHGETTIQGGKEVVVSESRRYILCLSNTALYFIVDDDFTARKNTTKRTFPSRMSPTATFGDAQWPHAVMRHSLDSLKRIVIGFQFQRLTLQFFVSNGVSSSSFEYTYVVLTSNKAKTVSLLQKLQSYMSDTQPDTGFVIENDDKLFLDGLGAQSEVVMHYQILHQIWKTGNREAARRSFVLTDSKIYLLDEIYSGDGTNAEEEKSNRIKLGDVSLSIIDEAKLTKVTEVRAANEDPRMITLVILPANKLKRSHRWRLVCNDGESAERLIDDVRNACHR